MLSREYLEAKLMTAARNYNTMHSIMVQDPNNLSMQVGRLFCLRELLPYEIEFKTLHNGAIDLEELQKSFDEYKNRESIIY